ncbi:hypothetical protein [Treponema sp. UBA3813]|uniref:hypothetical protein n=1 Tax=Treponema sp. UBA3813 TaxID=1947715 RepID=UPI0025F7E4D1|nr:hypothetical protein [Treponema sp. UBA3813]
MKKTIVHVADYELYKILLPWKSLFSGVNALILSELEKRHPRFSGNCCYDAKYLLERKNLMAEVVVMDKANLARYKRSGGALYLETEQKRSVFSGKARFFHGCTLILLVMAGLLSFRIAKSLQKESSGSLPSEDVEVPLSETPSLPGGEELVKEIFASVSHRGGKISSFSYRRNEGGRLFSSDGGKCSFSIYGCNSEDVANARYCRVSFKNNEPHFQLELPFGYGKTVGEKVSDGVIFSYEDELIALASVRKELRSLGAVIESEHNGEKSAEFAFSVDESHLYSCLKICGENAEKILWREKNLSLSEKAGKCRVELSFEKCESLPEDGNCGELLLLCSRYAYLFASELKIQPKVAKVFPIVASSKNTSQKIIVKEKIGEVKQSNGESLVCYRDINGKITFEKKELVNE